LSPCGDLFSTDLGDRRVSSFNDPISRRIVGWVVSVAPEVDAVGSVVSVAGGVLGGFSVSTLTSRDVCLSLGGTSASRDRTGSSMADEGRDVPVGLSVFDCRATDEVVSHVFGWMCSVFIAQPP
jgi:hypothetical protein